MDEIGKLLREAREKLGLTHEEAERATRIRARYLEALESGDVESLPSSVQARGFLRNYSDFLGLDTDAILLDYAQVIQASPRGRKGLSPDTEPATRPTVQVRSRRPRWLSPDLFVAAAITLVLLFVLVWGGTRVMQSLEQDRPNSQDSGFILLSSPTITPTRTPAPAPLIEGSPGNNPEPTQSGTLPPELTGAGPPESGIALRLLVERRAWVAVLVDGEEAFRGRVAPGEILEYRGETQIQLITGNASGLRIVFNGEDQGRLGGVGEVVDRIWTQEGVTTPTPSPTEISSETPEPTMTSTPSTNP
jgi:transcriptional regulator with XRE-family HTH domain